MFYIVQLSRSGDLSSVRGSSGKRPAEHGCKPPRKRSARRAGAPLRHQPPSLDRRSIDKSGQRCTDSEALYRRSRSATDVSSSVEWGERKFDACCCATFEQATNRSDTSATADVELEKQMANLFQYISGIAPTVSAHVCACRCHVQIGYEVEYSHLVGVEACFKCRCYQRW